MSTHNICFCGEIRKILCGHPLLSRAMPLSENILQWTLRIIASHPRFLKMDSEDSFQWTLWQPTVQGCLFVLRFYGPVNLMGSCEAQSVYLTTHLLGRLGPLWLTSIVHILSPETDKCPSWISGRSKVAQATCDSVFTGQLVDIQGPKPFRLIVMYRQYCG